MLSSGQREVFAPLRRVYGNDYNSGKQRAFGGYSGRGHWENRLRWKSSAKTIATHFRPRSALDLGCGRGSLIRELRELGVPAWGVDIGEDVRTPWGAVANACELPFGRRFDVVIALDIIEHVPWDLQDVLFKELRRVTGRFVAVTVPTETPHYKLTSAVPARNHYLCLPADEWRRHFGSQRFEVQAEGGELSPLGPPFGFGATNYPFVLRPA